MPDRQPFAAAKERRGIERTEPTFDPPPPPPPSFSKSPAGLPFPLPLPTPLLICSPLSTCTSSFPPLHPTVGQALTHLPSSFPSPHLFVPTLLPPRPASLSPPCEGEKGRAKGGRPPGIRQRDEEGEGGGRQQLQRRRHSSRS